MILAMIASLIFVGLLLAAALFDLFHMEIPNRISVALAFLYCPLAAMAGQAWLDIAFHYGIGLLVLAIMIVLFAAGFLGGGDGKLIAACTVWFGPQSLLFVFAMALVGGVVSLVIIMLRRWRAHIRTWSALSRLRHLVIPGGDVPYALAISLGALWAMEFPIVFS